MYQILLIVVVMAGLSFAKTNWDNFHFNLLPFLLGYLPLYRTAFPLSACLFSWTFKSDAVMNLLPHCEHTNLFSAPLCFTYNTIKENETDFYSVNEGNWLIVFGIKTLVWHYIANIIYESKTTRNPSENTQWWICFILKKKAESCICSLRFTSGATPLQCIWPA